MRSIRKLLKDRYDIEVGKARVRYRMEPAIQIFEAAFKTIKPGGVRDDYFARVRDMADIVADRMHVPHQDKALFIRRCALAVGLPQIKDEKEELEADAKAARDENKEPEPSYSF